MKNLVRSVCAAGALCLVAASASAQQTTSPVRHPPASAFGDLPFASQLALSRDGKYLATIQPVNGKPAGYVYDLDAGTPPIALPTGDWILRNIDWAPDDRLILTVKQSSTLRFTSRMYTWNRALTVDHNGMHVAVLMRNLATFKYNTNTADIVAFDQDHPDTVLATLYNFEDVGIPTASLIKSNEGKARLDLMKVDLKTGDAEIMMKGVATQDRETIDWIADGHGRVIGRVDRTHRPLQDHLMLYHDGSWVEAGTYDAAADNSSGVEGLTEDGKGLVLWARDKRSMLVLTRFDLATHKKTLLFAAPHNDVTGAIADQWTGRIIGASYVGDRPHRKYFNTKWEAVQLGLEKAFKGLSVAVVSSDMAGDRLIVAVEGPRQPPVYYFLNRTTHQAKPVGQAYPDLTVSELGKMEPYPYKARDGLEIPAYITLPPGKTAKNLPVVVMPHGGPDSRDYLHFDWWAQFLANRGYLVLQPNYRGSLGYGHKFTDAGLHQWGLKMQDDITDGVKKLIADGLADPKRICIVGASYGGYAALAGATFTPNLYACAVSFAGVSDLPTILGNESRRSGKESHVYSFWTSRIGSVFSDAHQLDKTSPARHADQVKCPILLMHGEGDTTVPIGQSEIEDKALKAAGKKVTFIRFSGEDHYLNTAETRIRVLKETEAFLKKYIGD